MDKLIVGLTGGIASGKSAVSGILSELGAYIIDADKISREVTADGSETLAEIEKAFPGTVANGKLDRLMLKKVAFATPEATKKLNSITHPAIFTKINDRIGLAPNGIIVLDVPLLFETGAEKLCNLTVTVACDEEMRINRIVKRDNIDEALAKQIVSKQMSEDERIKRATFVIENNSDLESLKDKVEKFYHKLKELY